MGQGHLGPVSLVCLLVAAIHAGRVPAAEDGRPVRIPGGVAGPDLKRAFVANADGGIDALELASGRELWSTGVASRPILAYDDRLVALTAGPDPAEAARVAILDVRDGRRVLMSEPIAPPGGPPLNPTPRSTCEARIVDGALVLSWATQGHYGGGAAAPHEIIQAHRKGAGGSARVDLKTGKVSPPPGEEGDARDQAAKRLAEQVARQGTPPFWSGRVSDSTFAALELEPDEEAEVLVLRTWDLGTSRPGRRVELARGPSIMPVVTADGRHLLVRGEEDEPWTVVALESGRPLTKSLVLEPAAQEPTVLGDLLLYVVQGRPRPRLAGGRTLKAVALGTGKPLWVSTITGPASLPPRP